jgi:hypothetical protein
MAGRQLTQVYLDAEQKVADWLLDHERRITTLEVKQPVSRSGKSSKKK